jgi:monoterpene epsilon-lactone hydrolase
MDRSSQEDPVDVDRSLLTLPVGSELNAAMDLLNREPGPRYVPGRSIPLPASVSDSFRETIAMPYRASEWMLTPADAAGWRDAVATLAKESTPFVLKIVEKLGVTYRPTTIDGVSAYEVSPKEIAPRHANRLVVDTHGGGYVFNPGEACLLEPAVIAASCGIEVLAVDYRMPPDHPFPAALDDAVAVWKAVISARPVSQVALAGGSAGGGLAMATVLRLKEEGIPLPAALALQTPWADLSEFGDTIRTNEWIDNVLVSYRGAAMRAAPLYAAGRDLGDPLLSPLRGDLSGFPPTILFSGTRDLFLSLAVLVHRKLRRAGVEADLHLAEGASHFSYFINPFAPESQELFAEMSGFLDRHLAG